MRFGGDRTHAWPVRGRRSARPRRPPRPREADQTRLSPQGAKEETRAGQVERPPRRQLGPRAHRGCQSKVTSGHPCPHLSLGGDLKHKPIGVRKKRRGRPSGGERAAPREPREGSLGRGQVEGGQRVGGLCDKRGTGDRGGKGWKASPENEEGSALSAFTGTEREVVCIWPDTSL